MGVAFEAYHVIAAMSLLGPGVAGGTGLCMQLHVVFGGSFFHRELELAAREADEEFAVPAGFANLAESEGAVFAYSETLSRWWQQFLVCISVILRWLFAIILGTRFLRFGLHVRAASRTLTPLPWAIDCIPIRLESFLPL